MLWKSMCDVCGWGAYKGWLTGLGIALTLILMVWNCPGAVVSVKVYSNTVHDIQSVNICVYDYIELYLNVSNFDWDALQTCMTLTSNEWVFAFSSFRFFFLDLIRTFGLLTASFALWIIWVAVRSFLFFLGRMTGFLGCFATPMAQACISDMFFQACQVTVLDFWRILGGTRLQPRVGRASVMQLTCWAYMPHTHNSILQAAFARASKSTVRLRQKTVHPTVAPSVEQLPPQPLQQLQRQPTRVRQLPQLPRPQYQVLGVFLCSVYVIGSSSDYVGRS